MKDVLYCSRRSNLIHNILRQRKKVGENCGNSSFHRYSVPYRRTFYRYELWDKYFRKSFYGFAFGVRGDPICFAFGFMDFEQLTITIYFFLLFVSAKLNFLSAFLFITSCL